MILPGSIHGSAIPGRVVQALRDHAHEKAYLPVKGLYELRQAVASFNRRTQGIEIPPENIMIGPGSKELIFLLQLVYYGDLVIPTPSWVSYSPQARIVGRQVYWVPTYADNFWRLGTFSYPPQLSWLGDAIATVASETFTATSSPIQYAAISAFPYLTVPFTFSLISAVTARNWP
jgi:aspartate/methionine/tyrosine aminotransferase